eukprot:jgi/Mesvir1/19206/Mv11518-RA.3
MPQVRCDFGDCRGNVPAASNRASDASDSRAVDPHSSTQSLRAVLGDGSAASLGSLEGLFADEHGHERMCLQHFSACFFVYRSAFMKGVASYVRKDGSDSPAHWEFHLRDLNVTLPADAPPLRCPPKSGRPLFTVQLEDRRLSLCAFGQFVERAVQNASLPEFPRRGESASQPGASGGNSNSAGGGGDHGGTSVSARGGLLQHVPGTTVVLDGSYIKENIYHCMERASGLFGIQRAGLVDNLSLILFLCPKQWVAFPWMAALLSVVVPAGVPVLFWEDLLPLAEQEGTFHFEKMVHLRRTEVRWSPPHLWFFRNPADAAELRSRVYKLCDIPHKRAKTARDFKTVTFLQRSNTRKVLNMDELVAEARRSFGSLKRRKDAAAIMANSSTGASADLAAPQSGWTVLSKEIPPSFCLQAQLFSNTSLLISPHGAHLTNMFMMAPGGAVIECLPYGLYFEYYKALADAIPLQWTGLISAKQPWTVDPPKFWHLNFRQCMEDDSSNCRALYKSQDMVIPVPKFHEALTRLEMSLHFPKLDTGWRALAVDTSGATSSNSNAGSAKDVGPASHVGSGSLGRQAWPGLPLSPAGRVDAAAGRSVASRSGNRVHDDADEIYMLSHQGEDEDEEEEGDDSGTGIIRGDSRDSKRGPGSSAMGTENKGGAAKGFGHGGGSAASMFEIGDRSARFGTKGSISETRAFGDQEQSFKVARENGKEGTRQAAQAGNGRLQLPLSLTRLGTPTDPSHSEAKAPEGVGGASRHARQGVMGVDNMRSEPGIAGGAGGKSSLGQADSYLQAEETSSPSNSINKDGKPLDGRVALSRNKQSELQGRGRTDSNSDGISSAYSQRRANINSQVGYVDESENSQGIEGNGIVEGESPRDEGVRIGHEVGIGASSSTMVVEQSSGGSGLNPPGTRLVPLDRDLWLSEREREKLMEELVKLLDSEPEQAAAGGKRRNKRMESNMEILMSVLEEQRGIKGRELQSIGI